MDHPWRRFRDRTDWLLEWAMLPPGLLGYTAHHRRAVILDKRLTQAERRCTIAHELEHFDVPTPADPVLRERLEQQINRRVARRLIPIRRLGDALAWSRDPHEIADELWVDLPTLETRMRHLHPAELAYLRQRAEHR